MPSFLYTALCPLQVWQTVEQPIFVSCSSGLRSHAVKVLIEALSTSEKSSEMLTRVATTKSAAILDCPEIVQWLTAVVDG